MIKNKDWFSLKLYPHIGLPIEKKKIKIVKRYIKNDYNISKHSFLPFIHKEITKRKFRKKYSEKNGKLLKGGKRIVFKAKKRELYYASHLDANIYAYYAFLLSNAYEKLIKETEEYKELNKIVTAYRRIPLRESDKETDQNRNKCNVDFANEIFTYIKQNKDKDLVAIAFDIKSFFDNLDHKILKQKWCKVLGVKCLNRNHYNVYKSLINFSFVEERDLFNKFKSNIYVKKANGENDQKSIKKIKYLRNHKAIAYCTIEDFYEEVVGKIPIKKNKEICKNKKSVCGIPQGTSISAILANIYMLDFDKDIAEKIGKDSAIYRRYSDDMVVVCSRSRLEDVKKIFKEITDKYELTIQDSKTQIFHFRNKGDKLFCYEKINEHYNPNKNFIYLGLEFDGETVRIKSASIAPFYRKMKRSIRRGKFYAKYTAYKDGNHQIFKRRLYKHFSYLGSNRRRKYIRDEKDPSKFHKTGFYDWGNYITYAKMAARNVDNNIIEGQIKRHWNILNKLIEKAKKEI